jgi:hypothetical protein
VGARFYQRPSLLLKNSSKWLLMLNYSLNDDGKEKAIQKCKNSLKSRIEKGNSCSNLLFKFLD